MKPAETIHLCHITNFWSNFYIAFCEVEFKDKLARNTNLGRLSRDAFLEGYAREKYIQIRMGQRMEPTRGKKKSQ